MVTDIANLPPLRDSHRRGGTRHRQQPERAAASDQRDKMTSLYGKLAATVGRQWNYVERTNELKGERDTQQVYAAVLGEATRLRAAVESQIERQRTSAQSFSARAISQIAFGRIVLIILSIAALAAAGLIAWLYVGRNIVGRLTLLSGAMRRIADGEDQCRRAARRPRRDCRHGAGAARLPPSDGGCHRRAPHRCRARARVRIAPATNRTGDAQFRTRGQRYRPGARRRLEDDG